MKSKLAVLFLLLLIPIAAAPLDPAVQSLSHSILKELIEINTTDTPRGNVTTAALAMQKRFAAAGLPASDMLLAGPNDRKQNLIVRLRGASTSLAAHPHHRPHRRRRSPPRRLDDRSVCTR